MLPTRLPDAGESFAASACRSVFASLDGEAIAYCMLRGDDRLESGHGDSEVDLLVEGREFERVRAVLDAHGFISEPAWGHAPHSFFSILDPPSGSRLTLDVVTDLRYGRPIRALAWGSAAGYLARRRRAAFGFALAPQDEFRHLLLHCALDKGEISNRHWQRLQLLAETLGTDPEVGRRFVRNQRPVFWHLFRASPFRSAWRWSSGQLARRLAPLFHAGAGRGLVVALLGPDGAGKSTLANGLAASHRRARRIYMGYGRDDGARHFAIVEWLLRHARTPARRRAGWAGALSGALRFWARCALQFGRGLAVRMHRRLGRLVVLDRYVWDTDERRAGFAAVRRRIIASLCPKPDLVVVLDAPAEVLHRRRPEHSIEELAAGRLAYRQISESFGDALVVDASTSIDRMRNEVAARLKDLRRTAAARTA